MEKLEITTTFNNYISNISNKASTEYQVGDLQRSKSTCRAESLGPLRPILGILGYNSHVLHLNNFSAVQPRLSDLSGLWIS